MPFVQTKPFSASSFEERVRALTASALREFKKITRFYSLFHLFMGLLVTLEILAFISFFSFFAKTLWLAGILGALFLTTFAYFVLRFYFQAKKPEQLLELHQSYFAECKRYLSAEKGSAEYHLSLTHAAYRLVSQLEQQESCYYRLPIHSDTINPLLVKFSRWSYTNDVHAMKEILLTSAIAEHIELIKAEPCDLEAHAALANAYHTLAKLYSPEEEKFQAAALRAIEEFAILDYFVPHDPWVHAQLATIYHSLGQFSKEIATYEKILSFAPNDNEILLRLGTLYFQNGLNAKGLILYEQLQRSSDPKASELIAHYGASPSRSS